MAQSQPTRSGNGISPNWAYGILATVVSGVVVSLFVWTFRSIMDINHDIVSMNTRQVEGYRRVDLIDRKVELLEERIRQLELNKYK